jgi:hypothetical protein
MVLSWLRQPMFTACQPISSRAYVRLPARRDTALSPDTAETLAGLIARAEQACGRANSHISEVKIMPEGPSRITFISVGWTDRNGKDMTIGVALLEKYCRPERVEDLFEDLALMCEDVETGGSPQDAGRLLALVPAP